MPPARIERVKLWDPLLRGFHWILAILVTLSWILGQYGPNVMSLHFYSGYAIIGLLVFRLFWGIFGPKSARFTHFLPSPKNVITYTKGLFERKPSYWPGHNPLGALAVIAMLALLIIQVSTGLIADPDDFINVGPLANQVSSATSRKAVGWHELGGSLILILVLLHVGMILFYRFWKRENLIKAMITGWKDVIRR